MRMIFNKYNYKTWIVFIIVLVIASITYQRLPDVIPAHFGISGKADRFASKVSIFFFPGMIACLEIVFAVFRKLYPKKEAYDSFEPYFYKINFGVSLLVFMLELLTIYVSVHVSIHVTGFMLGALGILISFIGNMLPKLKHNFLIGIRTSWTLADEEVWYLTHRFSAKIWVIGGLVMLFCILLPENAAAIVAFADMALLSLISIMASYLYYRRIHHD